MGNKAGGDKKEPTSRTSIGQTIQDTFLPPPPAANLPPKRPVSERLISPKKPPDGNAFRSKKITQLTFASIYLQTQCGWAKKKLQVRPQNKTRHQQVRLSSM